MQSFSRAAHALAAKGSMLLHTLRSPWLVALLALLALLLALAAQLPVQYQIEVGREEGYGGDLPLLSGFFPFEPEEKSNLPNWRWTSERAQVLLPGMGARPLAVSVRMLSVNTEVGQKGAQTFDVWANGRLLATAPVQLNGGTFSFLVPAPTNWQGNNGFEIRSATVIPSGDQRAIGIPIDAITVRAPSGPSLPALGSTLGWLCAALLAWLAVRCCGFSAQEAFALLIVSATLVALAAALDPPRTAFGVTPALVALAWGLALTTVLAIAVPLLAERLAVPLDAAALRWLLLLSLVAFTLRYGGKIYPQSMWGDLGFHTNRFLEVASGRVLLLSRNRGVDFPYPPGLYLLIAPFTLLGVGPRDLLRFGGALVDALSPLLVYTIAVLAYPGAERRAKNAERRTLNAEPRTLNRTNDERRTTNDGRFLSNSQRTTVNGQRTTDNGQYWAVAAAGLYSLCAATFMTTWWGFSTHIFAQFAHLLLIAALVLLVPRTLAQPAKARLAVDAGALLLMFCLVFLGHFGFWLNMSLLGGLGVAALVLAAWRKRAPWRVVWALGLAFAAAELISVATFYSAYSGLFLAQAQAAREGGLTGMAGRLPIPPDKLWYGLWYDGFRTHFGFFPVPLALVGTTAWATSRRAARAATAAPVVLVLIVGTLLIALGFAVLPFVSGSTLSTRWLMFSAWAVAITAIYAVHATWDWGWLVRLGYILMAGYILWVTASQWLGALAFRIRPPEPF